MIALLANVLLAGVFALAAAAKLADREGIRGSLAGFGVPVRVVAPIGWALVGCELGVAVALLVPPSSRAGALGALGLLAGFGGAVAWHLWHGRRPECHCFGRLGSAPVGWSTVARNGCLAVVAGFVAADGRLPFVFAGLGLVTACVWVALTLRESSRLRPGTGAPPFSLSDEQGREWALEAFLARSAPLVLVFSDPACSACQELMSDVASWQESLDERLTIAIVSAGSRTEHLATARRYGVGRLLADADRSVAATYGVSATPSAVLIAAEGTIVTAPAVGLEEIASLVARAVETDEDGRFGRRTLLTSAAAGVVSVVALPLVASAASAARTVHQAVRPKALKVDGAWLCDQRYALCTSAPCKQSETDPKIGICNCVVKRGYSVGFKSCKQRAPRGRQLHSNFSLQNVTGRTRVMTCSARGVWTQCLDVVCHVDPDNPKRALCQCVRMETKNFLTFGGHCDTETCSSVIWSATTAPFPGGAQYEKGLKRLGVPFNSPKSCPRSPRAN